MSKTDKDDVLLAEIRQQLQLSAEQLDPATRSALQQARQHALQAVERKAWSWKVPALALVASAAVVTLTISLLWTSSLPQHGVMEDLPVLTANEDFEMLEQLEFYQWLGDEEGQRG